MMYLLDVASDMQAIFVAFFFGGGAWLGLLVLMSFIIGLTMIWKYGAILMLPVCVFLGMAYLDYALVWHGLIIFLTGIFLIFYYAKARKG